LTQVVPPSTLDNVKKAAGIGFQLGNNIAATGLGYLQDGLENLESAVGIDPEKNVQEEVDKIANKSKQWVNTFNSPAGKTALNNLGNVVGEFSKSVIGPGVTKAVDAVVDNSGPILNKGTKAVLDGLSATPLAPLIELPRFGADIAGIDEPLTKDRINLDLLNEKVEDYYLTTGFSFGFRKKGLSLLLMPVSYTNNFNYKHIIETGLSGTYWLPGGSLGFGTGYIQNIIQNKSNDLKNPFSLPHKNNDFNSRVFYVYGEGSGRGILGFDYTTLRLTGKFFGENELYKLNQLITSFELSDFWKRVYLDLYFNHKVDKGNLILSDEVRRLDNLIEKYEVKGVLGIEFYF